jgi:hypothetical protein
MRSMLQKLWKDDGGAVLAIEFILFVVILLFGLIVGYVALRNAIVSEMSGVADAITDLSICFSYSGLTNCESSVCGSSVTGLHTQGVITPGKTAATDISVVVVNPCQ